MGYTLPGRLDEILDFIGINFPNVEEDDYHELADAMRDFAIKFEGHGGEAHKVVTRILSSSQGWAVDSTEKHRKACSYSAGAHVPLSWGGHPP